MERETYIQIVGALDEFYSVVVPNLERAGFFMDGTGLMDIMDKITGAVTSEAEKRWLSTDEAIDAEPQTFGYLYNTARRAREYPDLDTLYTSITDVESKLF